jgi:hypothetical protein
VVLLRSNEGGRNAFGAASRAGLILAAAIWLNSQAEAKPSSTHGPTNEQQHYTAQAPLFVEARPAPNTPEESAANERERNEKRKNDGNLVELTAALVAVGALQLGVFGYQSYVLRKTLSESKGAIQAAQRSAAAAEAAVTKSDDALAHARSTADRQLRAYVSVEQTGIIIYNNKPDDMFNGVVNIKIYWKNFGSTPANNINIDFSSKIFQWPENIPDNFDFPNNPNFVSARGAFAPTQGIWANTAIPLAVMNEVSERRAVVLLWSFIEYDDAQGIRRRTEWANTVNVSKNTETKEWRFEPAAYPRFNAIDEFCMRQPTQKE